jgi:hypothetical protein
MKTLCSLFALCVLSCGLHAQSVNSQAYVHSSGTVIATWNGLDSNGNTNVIGAIGSTSTDPSTWTTTELSAGIEVNGCTPPLLFNSPNGDVAVFYYFITSDWTYQPAMAMLPSGTTTWNLNTVLVTGLGSDTGLGENDQNMSIDSSGNMLATWTTNSGKVLGATATMGASSTWSAPFTVAD